jgi:hypothetical protein
LLVWLTAFVDLPPDLFDADVAFWLAVTDTTLSAPRGEFGEFASLLPRGGDPWLRVQKLHRGPARIHLDLHGGTDLADRAIRLGAHRVGEDPEAAFESPGGLIFCAVTEPLAAPAPAPSWPHQSIVDQLCIDIPRSRFDAEATFWSELLDREVRDSPTHEEFARLLWRQGEPLKVLLQRTNDDGPVRAHLDLATTDRPAEVARLVALGAALVRETPQWTTLRDPAGLEFCVTRRLPTAAVPVDLPAPPAG